MKQFEYKYETVDIYLGQYDVLQVFLNKMGAQGWELVSADFRHVFNDYYACIFKREKSPSPRQTAAIIRHVELKRGRRK